MATKEKKAEGAKPPGRAMGIALAAIAAAAGVAAIVAVVRVARGQRSAPQRCPAGTVVQGSRCCGQGQHLDGERCRGTPTACARGLSITPEGCVVGNRRVAIHGGRLALGPSDWEAQGVVAARVVTVRTFSIDSTEVTVARWQRCVDEAACKRLDRADETEPGRPVRGVTAEAADRFCRLEGGRLPTSDEWLYAAAGKDGRRFPWGPTGLVCRRAAFGLVSGPCGEGSTGPDLAGVRPAGATPEGVHDLAGNVAEWTREPDGSHVAHGGSFRSRVAADLKSWAAEAVSPAAAHVGFRCVYPAAPEAR